MLGRTIDEVTAGGPAARAGLTVGDEVTAVDGAAVSELDGRSVMAVIAQRPVGSAAVLTVLRAGATRIVRVVVRAADY
jgi:C-terminal processing protease CtpA/Prc